MAACCANTKRGTGFKNELDPQDAVDHFACYNVQELSRLPRTTVTLRDQFGPPEDQNPDQVRVRSAKVLCAPVDKNGEGVLFENFHLVCYDVAGHDLVNKNVEVTNQLGVQKLRVKQRVTLCVPSRKQVVPGGPPGHHRHRLHHRRPRHHS